MTHHEHENMKGSMGQKKDPVCGMAVPADTPHKGEHGGKTFLFCSPGCVEKFRKDPSRYAA